MDKEKTIEKVIKLYREYAVGQNTESVVFVETVYNIVPVFDMDGKPFGEVRFPAYIFRIFDTERGRFLYTLVYYNPIGFVTEIGYADSADELESMWENGICESGNEDSPFIK